jgi:hypothetical protein
MPVILDPADHDLWFAPDVQDAKQLESLLMPFASEGMAAYPVSTLANNPRVDDPKCMEAVSPRANDPPEAERMVRPNHRARRWAGSIARTGHACRLRFAWRDDSGHTTPAARRLF